MGFGAKTMGSYFKYTIEAEAKYSKVVVMMQIGSFYEIYGVNNKKEKIGVVEEMAKLMDIRLTYKNTKKPQKNVRSNPMMVGIPCHCLREYLEIVVDAGYTVVKIDQVSEPPNCKREITRVYSPGTYIDDITAEQNYLAAVYLETNTDCQGKTKYSLGFAAIDLGVGNSVVYEYYAQDAADIQSVREEVYRMFAAYEPREIVVAVRGESGTAELFDEKQAGGVINHIGQVPKEYRKASYQDAFFERIYPDTGALGAVEFAGMERMPMATVAYIVLLEFAREHEPRIIERIEVPKILTTETGMILYNNAIEQLNVVESGRKQETRIGSLIDVIGKGQTPMGRRLIRERLLNPIKDAAELEQRYSRIEKMTKAAAEGIAKTLNGIPDLDRINRRITLKSIKPFQLANAYDQYSKIAEFLADPILLPWAGELGLEENDRTLLAEFVERIERDYIIEVLAKSDLDDLKESFYAPRVNAKLDEIQAAISMGQEYLEEWARKIRKWIQDKDPKVKDELVKVIYNERDGYYISATKVKTKLARDKVDEAGFECRDQTGARYRITDATIVKYNRDFHQLKWKLRNETKEYFLECVEEFGNKYFDTLHRVAQMIGRLDLWSCIYLRASQYGYCRPRVLDESGSGSGFQTKGLRHPIIERLLTRTTYVPNDVELTEEGMLLFGLNAAGKSSLMKAVGLAVIMAQAGFYVAAEEFVYRPYDMLFTRITGDDNIFRGQSSFAVEMMELRSILKYANRRSLVLGDEICKGTEHNSALSIVSTAIQRFSAEGIAFIFATHLHQLSEYTEITALPNILIRHLAVEVGDNIVYNRKLAEGPGDDLYGIEVAKYYLQDSGFIRDALKKRGQLLNEPEHIVVPKQSRYNANVYVHNCEVCGKTSVGEEVPLDVHHIHFQSSCNEEGLAAGYIPKNMRGNLVVLCKEHHQMVHSDKLKIEGWKETVKGPELSYQFSDDLSADS